MDDTALQKYLLRLFERHDVELEVDEDGWLVTDGDFPAVRASWQEGPPGEPGRLDLDVVLSEERHIEESFAGSGGGDTGCRDALHAFEQSAFHVLLAACWYVTDDRRMRIAAWDIGVRTWDVFIGPFGVRGAGAASMPAEALASIEAALQREALSPELHWLRLVHSHAAAGDSRCEALLDNEPWTAGTLALAAVPWPRGSDYVARCFMLLDVRDY
ncbi:hypothetical protein DEO45_14555 [Rhodanobacter denitrificans]|uniref:Uncharacterized protein n=1 Tax=Rhodanobacter denitrificans TaxID=666685 RepID=A0A368KAE6_9GAMM|nr:DUF6348 family protein [Rhodanobacter denitrificans]RCS28912.1 hypothetical protein DEO45_14555 [Rhodanobacter denitrificans]